MSNIHIYIARVNLTLRPDINVCASLILAARGCWDGESVPGLACATIACALAVGASAPSDGCLLTGTWVRLASSASRCRFCHGFSVGAVFACFIEPRFHSRLPSPFSPARSSPVKICVCCTLPFGPASPCFASSACFRLATASCQSSRSDDCSAHRVALEALASTLVTAPVNLVTYGTVDTLIVPSLLRGEEQRVTYERPPLEKQKRKKNTNTNTTQTQTQTQLNLYTNVRPTSAIYSSVRPAMGSITQVHAHAHPAQDVAR